MIYRRSEVHRCQPLRTATLINRTRRTVANPGMETTRRDSLPKSSLFHQGTIDLDMPSWHQARRCRPKFSLREDPHEKDIRKSYMWQSFRIQTEKHEQREQLTWAPWSSWARFTTSSRVSISYFLANHTWSNLCSLTSILSSFDNDVQGAWTSPREPKVDTF